MYNRRYDKLFIMLRQEMSGFSLGQRPAWGSCILEIKNGKGRFTVSIQGLKKLSENREYIFYIIGGKLGKADGIACEEIYVDHHGKAELKWDFDPDDISGTGYTIEDLHTVAIFAGDYKTYGVTAPLAGYFSDKVNWKSRFHEIAKKINTKTDQALLEKIKKIEPVPTKVSKTETKEVIQKDLDEVKEVTEVKKQTNEIKSAINPVLNPETNMLHAAENNIQKDTEELQEKQKLEAKEAIAIQPKQSTGNSFHKNFHNMLIKFQNELSELEKHGVLSSEDMEKINKAGKSSVQNIQNNIKSNTSLKLSDIDYIFKHNEEIAPFLQDKKKWKCISIEELAVLPFDTIKMIHDIFFVLSYRKYRHFILGKDEDNTLYLGIPDTYQPENKNAIENFGFANFTPCNGENIKPNCYGYWIKKWS